MTELLRNETVEVEHMDAAPLDSAEFFTQFTEAVSIAGKGDHISIATMGIDPREKATFKLARELIGASARGANVQIAVDDYGYRLARQIGLVATPLVVRPDAMDNRRKAHRALENAGATITTVNTNAHPIVPLYEGRSHIKIYAINDVAYIGGQNLIDTWRLDTAVRLRQPTAVEMLHKTVADLVKIGSTKKVFQDEDQRLMLPDGSELLRDAGKPGQSLIMDEALALIDDAEESIAMTTQLFPRGVVARRLQAAARRGVAVNVACDHNHAAPTVVRLLADGMHTTLRLIYGNDAAGHFTPKGLQALHSKILVSEKAAIVGSHNFDPTGVRLGNAEVSYLSRDPVFITKVGKIVLAQTTLASA